ncbi:gamma-glutamyltranspeptidase/glutathione hydrolase [Catenuloplanes nepalensis]|uniref:Gamma-glutamyltranspeptidase/glutathione hydrolase n=1 Tax=Catenuloplanes nepalensis TaxID=587533 RepID=A0ABT9N5V2_9ACTN|nr:gamma-glutamyltransferase [Catenuloplanes nepalensis]MDP9799088.1 gamma-glutamyltranspeptidase/glutathione hydrolase [Catenuloplanes nepalensis]
MTTTQSARKPVPPAVAAGHPATAEAGLRALAAGGTAADAAVAAVLASAATESIFTGLGGGGFAIWYDAATRDVTCLDFFCAVPGLDGDVTAGEMMPTEVAFGAVPVTYSIGGASVAVPGVPAGTGEVHRRWGTLPWSRVVEPATLLARTGVPLPAEHAHTLIGCGPALSYGAGEVVYRPEGRYLNAGERLFHPGLEAAMTELADEGPSVFYTGRFAKLMVDAVRATGGALGPADLAAYRVRELPVHQAPLAGQRVLARHDLNRLVATIGTLPAGLATLPRPDRAVAVARALADPGPQRLGDTTNVAAVDAHGNACVITTTLGLGAGVWLPGLGVHLNSMLGEAELVTAGLAPGSRMSSMMCPLVVLDDAGGLVLAGGSAGASRIRTALIHTLIATLIDGLDMPAAIARPRFHVVGDEVHAEAGVPEDELAAMEAAGLPVNRWDHLSHYFGGTSAIGRSGAAADPRRGGIAALL